MPREAIGQDLIDEVVRLHDEDGWGFRKIADHLSMSQTHAHRIYQKAYPVKTGPKPLTLKQRQLITAAVESGSLKQAAKKVGISPDRARRYMQDERVQDNFKSLLERKGIGEEALAEKLAQLKEAKRTTQYGVEPDNQVQMKAVDLGFKLHGRGMGETEQRNERPTKIVIMAAMADNFAALCGGKLPEQFIEVVSDEAQSTALPAAGEASAVQEDVGADFQPSSRDLRNGVEQVESDAPESIPLES